MNVRFPLTIFFDDSCPVCRHEIALLRQYDHNQQLAFVDCSAAQFSPPADAPAGVTREAMMSRIHARDADGQWLASEKVFAAAYDACGFALLATVWGSSRMTKFWGVAYGFVADHRMLLSKLGVGVMLAWILRLLAPSAAKRAATQSRACADDRCEIK